MNNIYKDTLVGFHRVYNGPLDKSQEVINGLEVLLRIYLKEGNGYPGEKLISYEDGYLLELLLIQANMVGFTEVKGLWPVVRKWPGNSEPILKEVGGHTYCLIYYYNREDPIEGTYYIDIANPFHWSMICLDKLLGMASNFDSKCKYIVTRDDESYHLDIPYISGSGYKKYSHELESIEDGFGTGETDNFQLPTALGHIGLFPKKKLDSEITLWVQCDDYLKLAKGLY